MESIIMAPFIGFIGNFFLTLFILGIYYWLTDKNGDKHPFVIGIISSIILGSIVVKLTSGGTGESGIIVGFIGMLSFIGIVFAGLVVAYMYSSIKKEKSEDDKSKCKFELKSDFNQDFINDQFSNTKKLEDYLRQAEFLGKSGDLEKASELLEQAYNINPQWAFRIAGNPASSFGNPQFYKPSGYGLLVELSSRNGKRNLSVLYLKRMFELNPERPDLAWQAARSAKIIKEATLIAQNLGISFHGYNRFI